MTLFSAHLKRSGPACCSEYPANKVNFCGEKSRADIWVAEQMVAASFGSMIIGVNLLSLRIDGGGTRHFAESLLLELACPPFSQRHVLLLFCHPELVSHLESLFKGCCNVSVLSVCAGEDVVASADSFDVYFCPLNAFHPVIRSRPSVSCLMDIQERYFPEYFKPEELELRAVLYPSLVHESTLACTISDYCGESFVEKMGADRSAVRVVRLYPQKRLLEAAAEPPSDCPDEFMLYPANWYAHKNVRNLVSGYLQARRSRPGLPALVLVGHPLGDGRAWLDELVKADPEASNIRVYTEIPASGLRGLYERARFIVLPTLFEGYCMPLAEAIVFGRPVLANDLPVMREIGGEWPVYAELESAEDIAEGLLSMCGSAIGPPRAAMPPALADWNWTKIAWEYETIFNQALVRHRISNLIP